MEDAASELAHRPITSQFCYKAKDDMPRDDNTHSGWSHTASTSNEAIPIPIIEMCTG